MSKYIVLAFDDKPHELKALESAVRSVNSDIVFKKISSADKACEYLEDHIEDICGAILDMEANLQEGDNKEDKTSCAKVRDKLNELKHRNNVEYFVFTGKGKYVNSDWGDMFNCKVFDKNYQFSAAADLLLEIVSKHADTQIKASYEKAFAIFDCVVDNAPVLDYTYQHRLINLVMAWDNYSLRNSGLMYGLIRPITEKLIKILMIKGIIDENLQKWNERSKALEELGKQFPEEVPAYIVRAVHTIFDVCPEGIHDCPLFDMINKGQAPFLLQSITLELFNLLAWFPGFISKHLDRNENIQYFKYRKFTINKEAIIEVDDKGNYHCEEYLIGYKKAEGHVGEKVLLTSGKPNTSSSSDIYKTFAEFNFIEE